MKNFEKNMWISFRRWNFENQKYKELCKNLDTLVDIKEKIIIAWAFGESNYKLG